MRRRVPSTLEWSNMNVQALVQITLYQAKARGVPAGNLEEHHRALRKAFDDFESMLSGFDIASKPGPTDWKQYYKEVLGGRAASRLVIWPFMDVFNKAVLHAYHLGSASPDPAVTKAKKRIDGAMKARAQGWEEPVEQAIAQAFKTMDPDTPNDIIIRYVRAEMKRRKINIPESKRDPDSFLRKRIQSHREMARPYAPVVIWSD
jgi:hypothetical protein